MKAVILAGGTGSRLCPLTKTSDKHLLPVGRRFHRLFGRWRRVGRASVLPDSGRDGRHRPGGAFGGGIHHRGRKVRRSLGRQFTDRLSVSLEPFSEQRFGTKVLLKKVEDPERFGVPELRDRHYEHCRYGKRHSGVLVSKSESSNTYKYDDRGGFIR